MNTTILGVAVLVIGAVLLGFGYHFSQAPVDQISNSLTGRFTDNTMWYFAVGVAMMVGGGLLAASGKRT
jgi:drug/metabolite transporter (DMT)-like permease